MEDLTIDEYKKDEPLFDIWARRNPRFELKYKDSVIDKLNEWMKGTNRLSSANNKVIGAGYESYIMAFFIGLYAKKRKKLTQDVTELGKFGHPIQYWGNIEERDNRHPYPSLRKYIFIALVARTEFDWISLEKGELKVTDAVRTLINTMEEYANYGYSVIESKLAEDKMYFYDNHSFLNIFRELVEPTEPQNNEDIKPESLD